MIRRKKSLQGMAYVFVLLIAVIILFQWFTTNNSRRMIERNKNYGPVFPVVLKAQEPVGNAAESIFSKCFQSFPAAKHDNYLGRDYQGIFLQF